MIVLKLYNVYPNVCTRINWANVIAYQEIAEEPYSYYADAMSRGAKTVIFCNAAYSNELASFFVQETPEEIDAMLENAGVLIQTKEKE